MAIYQTMTLRSGTILEYGLVVPADFDPAKRYPILLALPPGPQTKEMVQWGLENYWAQEALRRGWIILSPVAPAGVLFFQGAEGIIPEFLSRTATLLKPEGGKYHLAGVSNGGISAFRVALNQPELFSSLMVLPGFPQNDNDFERLNNLTGLPVVMFVGENDDGWVQRMEATAERLTELGGQAELEIVPGENHVIQSLSGGVRLFDLLESFHH
jgi:pimeloyl-ACP methyl ester carboxylesterase